MGAVQSQRPPHSVELRLEYPHAASSSAFFAHVHSEAAGVAKYAVWGEPQALTLWADDVITVTIYTARGQEEFDRFQCAEFAEVYIPWGIIAGQMADGVEVVFSLGFLKLMPFLGHSAALTKYMEAFHRSYSIAEEDSSAPQLRIGIRMAAAAPRPRPANSTQSVVTPPPPVVMSDEEQGMPMPMPVTTSNLVASGTRELSSEEMKRLFQLQVRNQELRALLKLDDASKLEVEEQVADHVNKLKNAVKMNYGLRAEQKIVDQELLHATSQLTEEQRMLIAGDLPTAPGSQPELEDGEDGQDAAEYERRATTVMAEIQAITRGNIELISEFDEQIKALEAELVEVRQRPQRPEEQQVPPLGAKAEALQEERREQATANLREASRTLQQQDEALMTLEQEINILQRSLGEVRGAERASQLPARELEEDRLATEEQRELLRMELRDVKERLDAALVARAEARREVDGLRSAQDVVAARERERDDERLHKDALEKELSRSQCRIGLCDEKIERLRSEAADIRERAALVLQAAPDVAGGRSPRTEQALGMEQTVRQRQEELQAARSAENVFRRERDEVQQVWEAAKVEAAVLEHKMRLLQGQLGKA